jgi:hypothetical protein
MHALHRRIDAGLPGHPAFGVRLLGVLVVMTAALCACDDTSSPASQGLLLEQPLTLGWAGKDSGVPFESRGVWSARANLRARWKFRLEARPADPDDPRWHGSLDPPVYSTEFSSQDQILFSWDTGMVNANRYAFSRGDTCTAQVTLEPALDPGEAVKAVFTFVIGG